MKTKKSVFYVDDDEDIRSIVQYALEDDDEIELIVCESGSEVLHKLQEKSADLILLDVMMPGMDGPTTLTNIRALPKQSDVPVLFITAKVQPNEVKQFKEMGALDVISKPFDPMLLPQQVKRYL